MIRDKTLRLFFGEKGVLYYELKRINNLNELLERIGSGKNIGRRENGNISPHLCVEMYRTIIKEAEGVQTGSFGTPKEKEWEQSMKEEIHRKHRELVEKEEQEKMKEAFRHLKKGLGISWTKAIGGKLFNVVVGGLVFLGLGALVKSIFLS